MKRSCENIERMLVDYADGQLSQIDANKIKEHLSECQECRKLLTALQKSLELAGVIWSDGLADTEKIPVSIAKTTKVRWSRYAAIAASILLVTTASVVWHTFSRPKYREPTFAEIERKINESGSAAQLLAATELLDDNPRAENIVKQQYQHIVKTYPDTAAAKIAKSRIE
ncbi:MAG: zf-HC2 domain-containing protein [Sedimentisphaerales bacterium]|nr:zf-HC2 domain-containing protein [Sedimentisphaerales bacterium]